MSEISELVSALRNAAHPKTAATVERTKLEKLATIALIHDQISKRANLKMKALKALGLTAPSLAAGAYGYSSGSEEGLQEGRKEMYEAAAPYVYGARRRAEMLEQMANKNANMRRALIGAGALSAAGLTGFGTKSVAKDYSRDEGMAEVAEAAKRDIVMSQLRAMRAAQKIKSLGSV